MLTVVKLAMRLGALIIAVCVALVVHGAVKDTSLAVAEFGFFVLWASFSFAVVLVASSWFIGGTRKLGALNKKGPDQVQRQQRSMQVHFRDCAVKGCGNSAQRNSLYCLEHRLACSPVERAK